MQTDVSFPLRYASDMKLAVAVLLVLAITPSAQARERYYRSVDGSMVHSPTRGNWDYGPVTARCADGSRSFSHHHQGTCSHHGGVTRWER